MSYDKKVFNENSLRKIVKDTSRAELKKELKELRFEMKKIWDFLNKLREETIVLNAKMQGGF